MGREILYKEFNKKGFKVGAEVGVQYGINALDMFKHIPGLKLYLIDPWEKNERYDASRARRIAKRRVAPYNSVVINKKSIEASFEIPDKSLDFVYIDGDHSYSAVMLDIILWSQKVRDGGMISGHDYYRYQQGVKTAVDDYVRYHGAASREGANLRKADPKIELQLYKGHNWSWKM